MCRLLLILLVVPQLLLAETVQLVSKIDFAPEKVIGLIFNQHGTSYCHETKVSTDKLGQTIVRFEAPEEVSENTFASALLIKANGEVSFASVSPLVKPEIDYAKLPTCQSEVPKNYSQQAAVLKQLVDVRRERVQSLKHELDGMLRGDFLGKIKKLEQEKGFVNKKPLSANLEPSELNIRLFKLVQSFEN